MEESIPPEPRRRSTNQPYLVNSTPSRDNTRRSTSVSFAELESSMEENTPSFNSRDVNQGMNSTPTTSMYFDNGEPVTRSPPVSTPIDETRIDQQNVSNQSDKMNESFSYFENLVNTDSASPNMAPNVSPIANVDPDGSEEGSNLSMSRERGRDRRRQLDYMKESDSEDERVPLSSEYELLERTLADDDGDELLSSSNSEDQGSDVDYVGRVDREPLPLREAKCNLDNSIGSKASRNVIARLDLFAAKARAEEQRADNQMRRTSDFNNRTMVDQIKNVLPRDIGHMSTTSLYEDQTNAMKQNNHSIINPMLNNTNISLLDDIDVHQLNKNLQDFPLAAELFRNKRVSTMEAENASYMQQLNNELQESKTSLLADRIARKGDDQRSSVMKPKPAYRFEASTRPKSYKGLRIYTPPHASRPMYSDDPRKWGAGHNTHHNGEGFVLDAIGDAASIVYSNVGPLVSAGSWMNNKFSGGGRCHHNAHNCWGGRKIYPDSLSDFTTILGL